MMEKTEVRRSDDRALDENELDLVTGGGSQGTNSYFNLLMTGLVFFVPAGIGKGVGGAERTP